MEIAPAHIRQLADEMHKAMQPVAGHRDARDVYRALLQLVFELIDQSDDPAGSAASLCDALRVQFPPRGGDVH
jgi:hypothetical protein